MFLVPSWPGPLPAPADASNEHLDIVRREDDVIVELRTFVGESSQPSQRDGPERLKCEVPPVPVRMEGSAGGGGHCRVVAWWLWFDRRPHGI